MHYNNEIINEIFTCSCFFDYSFLATTDLEITYFQFMNGLPNEIFHDVFSNSLIISCSDLINFACESSDGQLYYTCSMNCLLEYCDPYSCNCLDFYYVSDMKNFRFDNFCFVCRKIIDNYLLQKNYRIVIYN